MAQNEHADTGLGYRHDWNAELQQMFQLHAAKKQKELENRQFSEYLGKMMEVPTVKGEGPKKQLEEHVMKINGELADYFIENPDTFSDPGKFAKMRSITKKYVDNPYVERDLRVEEQRKIFLQNKPKLNEDEIRQEETRYAAYLNGELDEYTYGIPDKMTYHDILMEDAAEFGLVSTRSRDDATGVVKTNVIPDKAAASKVAIRSLTDPSDPARRKTIEESYNAMGGANLGMSLTEWYTENMMNTKNIQALEDYTYSIYNPNNTDGVTIDNRMPRFRVNYWDQLYNSMTTGQPYRSMEDPQLMVFSTKQKGETTFTIGDEIYFPGNRQALNSKEPKPGQQGYLGDRYLFNGPVKAEVLSAQSIVSERGVNPYVELSVDFWIPEGSDTSEDALSSFAKKLKENNFTVTSEKSMGSNRGVMILNDGTTLNKWSGTILVPANINGENIAEYDKGLYNEKTIKALSKQDDYTGMGMAVYLNQVLQQPGWKLRPDKLYYENPNVPDMLIAADRSHTLTRKKSTE